MINAEFEEHEGRGLLTIYSELGVFEDCYLTLEEAKALRDQLDAWIRQQEKI